MQKGVEVADTFAEANKDAKELQAKVIPVYLSKSKIFCVLFF